MNNEVLKILLDHKLSFLDTIAQTSMLWWVSSIVFCCTIIAVLWHRREDIIKIPGLNMVCFLITVLLASFPVYAIWVILGTNKIEYETKYILKTLELPTDLLFEFTGIKIALFIGGTTFFLVLIAWLWIWKKLNQMSKTT